MRTFYYSALLLPLILCGSSAQVVINEFMFNPTTSTNEWVELYNPTSLPVNLTGWTIADSGGDPVTLSGIVPAGGYLVVARDRPAFLAEYPSVEAACVVEATFRQLNDGGGDRVTVRGGTATEEVSYRSKWGEKKGVSLERTWTDKLGSDSGNWHPSTAAEGATPCRANSMVASIPFGGLPPGWLLRYDRSNQRIIVRWAAHHPPRSLSTFSLTGEKESEVIVDAENGITELPATAPAVRIVVATWDNGEQQSQLIPCN